jgi:nucleoid DNA-binding protein
MSKDKISTQEIAELLSLKAGISKKAADDFIKQLFATIEDSLLTGEQVKVRISVLSNCSGTNHAKV